MTETDLQLGGGYTYQWECAILLALNYFFEPVRYDPTLFDLITSFLEEVETLHLEGEDRESGVDLEDINLVGGERRILIQVKTKQAEGRLWRPSDPLLLKALYRFYDSRLLTEQPDDIRFVFLTNRPFNSALVKVKGAIQADTLDNCPEADKLGESLDRYAQREKGVSLDTDRFRRMLARTALVEYLSVDSVKANVQAKLQARGRSDWPQAHAVLFEHFSRQSTRVGGGIVSRESIVEVLGPGDGGKPTADTPPGIHASHGGVVQFGDGIAITAPVQGGVTIVQGGVSSQPLPPVEDRGYNMATVRDLLLAAFTAANFRRLFLYTDNPDLRPVGAEFADGDGPAAMVEKAIRFCQSRDLLPDLLREVKRENPRQYRRYAHLLRS